MVNHFRDNVPAFAIRGAARQRRPCSADPAARGRHFLFWECPGARASCPHCEPRLHARCGQDARAPGRLIVSGCRQPTRMSDRFPNALTPRGGVSATASTVGRATGGWWLRRRLTIMGCCMECSTKR